MAAIELILEQMGKIMFANIATVLVVLRAQIKLVDQLVRITTTIIRAQDELQHDKMVGKIRACCSAKIQLSLRKSTKIQCNNSKTLKAITNNLTNRIKMFRTVRKSIELMRIGVALREQQ